MVRLTFFLSTAIIGGALFGYALFADPNAWVAPLFFLSQIIVCSYLSARCVHELIAP
jgi:hypothetical protein